MFQINDYVVYGKTGVCQIDAIKKHKFIGDAEAEYNIMHPVEDERVTVMTPVANPKVFMRSLTTREKIDRLIKNMPTFACGWITDDRQRRVAFKTALHSGICEEWIKMIRGAYLKKGEGTGRDKRLHPADEEIVKSAERLLYEEFSVSLQIPLGEVEPYILSHLPQAV